MTFKRMSAQLLYKQQTTNPFSVISFAKNNLPDISEENMERFTKMCALNSLKVVIYQPSTKSYEIMEPQHQIDKDIRKMNLEMIYNEMSCPYKN